MLAAIAFLSEHRAAPILLFALLPPMLLLFSTSETTVLSHLVESTTDHEVGPFIEEPLTMSRSGHRQHT